MYYRHLSRITQAVVMLSLTCSASVSFSLTDEPEQNIPMEDVQRFSNAIAQIKQYYVKPISDKELFDNAIRGMLAGLDPHSGYLDEADFNELQTSTNGEFGGLGLEVTLEEGVIKVVSPLSDTPAAKAKLKSGDYIIKIGSRSVQGIELKEAVNLMRGKIGEPVSLTVVRKGENQPRVFDLVRENIQIKSVQTKLLADHYGYIHLVQFQALTAQDMLKNIALLKKQAGGKLKGLVLDLRNNPGGLLDSAIEIADAFINTHGANNSQELIVYTEGRLPSSKFIAVATPGDVLDNAPLVVLINSGSASASEIVAGALKDHKRGLIVGTRSFGKGTVQTVLPLDSTHGIKLTTAMYYTPSGTSIQAQGITPDIVIEEMAIPSIKSPQTNALNFSEADLSGHLSNGNPSKPEANSVTASTTGPSNEENQLLHEDYQLYAALTILKSLVVAKQ